AGGLTATATYQITPPGRRWSFKAHGSYSIIMQPASVRDVNGSAVAGGTLGTFSVRIPAPATPAVSTAPLTGAAGKTPVNDLPTSPLNAPGKTPVGSAGK